MLTNIQTTKPAETFEGFNLLELPRKASKKGEATPAPLYCFAPVVSLPEVLTDSLKEVLVDTLNNAQRDKVRALFQGGTTAIDSEALAVPSLVDWLLASASSGKKLTASDLEAWFLSSSIAATISAELAAKQATDIPAKLAAIALRFGKLAAPVPALSIKDAEGMLRRAKAATDSGRELVFCIRKLEAMFAPAEETTLEGL